MKLCRGCNETKELSWPNPASFSVDHVTPISLGGPDLRSNVQASHLGCNLKKGAK